MAGIQPTVTGAYFPFLAPPEPYSLPGDPFDKIIEHFGLRLGWGKSHICACTAFATPMSPAGSPNPSCITCQGRGIYWDMPLVSFVGLITYGHTVQASNEPGARMDSTLGHIIQGDPRLTISPSAGVPWEEASEFDVFVETDATMRFNASLSVGGVQYVPYQHNVTVAPSGAVSTWSPSTSGIVQVHGYSVSGAQVVLPAGYASGTPYIVEFTAAPAYVAFRLDGSFPHNRPFVQGTIAYPKRFRLTPLDLWLRDGVASNF